MAYAQHIPSLYEMFPNILPASLPGLVFNRSIPAGAPIDHGNVKRAKMLAEGLQDALGKSFHPFPLLRNDPNSCLFT
jgi:hypothetical protein